MSYFFLGLAIACNVGHTVLLKFSARAADVPVTRYALLAAALAVGLGTAFWNAKAMEKLDLIIVFPTNSALTMVTVFVVGVAGFGEAWSLYKTFGALALIAGVYLFNQ